jgi:hypothetical protein
MTQLHIVFPRHGWPRPAEPLITAFLWYPCPAGKWFIGLLQAGVLAYMLHSWAKKQHMVDATDAFKQLPVQKKVRMGAGAGFRATSQACTD